jgi:hypothetical protein
MAPIQATSILFKDFVNKGPVPEDNFVVKKTQVQRVLLQHAVPALLAECACRQLLMRTGLHGKQHSMLNVPALLLQVDSDALKDGEVLVSLACCRIECLPACIALLNTTSMHCAAAMPHGSCCYCRRWSCCTCLLTPTCVGA